MYTTCYPLPRPQTRKCAYFRSVVNQSTTFIRIFGPQTGWVSRIMFCIMFAFVLCCGFAFFWPMCFFVFRVCILCIFAFFCVPGLHVFGVCFFFVFRVCILLAFACRRCSWFVCVGSSATMLAFRHESSLQSLSGSEDEPAFWLHSPAVLKQSRFVSGRS